MDVKVVIIQGRVNESWFFRDFRCASGQSMLIKWRKIWSSNLISLLDVIHTAQILVFLNVNEGNITPQ